ncbi:nuclear transport factor 2 family protein [Amycolatopsis sp.]|uniref:nuclear transport factor 2 family protein n=1 Tax=Amycolatopsis sp. TaxID=37632 RepID=UPI002B6037E5|nr:nuclear transport factor 2 family protein [Amycolatopsis sp.]HVV12655.1 nuclear transport factor 2 family protein [Amycolatopsis sp.]
MEMWELVAREEVRNTIAGYNHAGDRGRLADLAATFTEDGVLHLEGREPAEGREAIVRFLSGVVAEGSRTDDRGERKIVRHFVANVAFEHTSPTEIRTAAYFVVFNAHGPDHWGRYRDRHVPGDGRWLIAHRYVRVDAIAEGSNFAG